MHGTSKFDKNLKSAKVFTSCHIYGVLRFQWKCKFTIVLFISALLLLQYTQIPTTLWIRIYYRFPVKWEENLEIGPQFEDFLGVNFKLSSTTTRQKQATKNLCRECHSRQNLKSVLTWSEICSNAFNLFCLLNKRSYDTVGAWHASYRFVQLYHPYRYLVLSLLAPFTLIGRLVSKRFHACSCALSFLTNSH
jgi:hypothetical protein